jgi:2-hydroxychromene-2-carboxylate isomerase
MSASIEFWFEFASTYSYPAAMRVDYEAARRGVEVVWRPFLLGPIFKTNGWTDSPFNLWPAKGRYMVRDLERTCAALELKFVLPKPFPQNGLLGARAATALDNVERAAFARALYRLEFAEGRNISDESVVAAALAAAGVATNALEMAQTEKVKASLRANTEKAQDGGVFGAPSFIAEDGEMFWGNDRLDAALDWAVGLRKG